MWFPDPYQQPLNLKEECGGFLTQPDAPSSDAEVILREPGESGGLLTFFLGLRGRLGREGKGSLS